MGAATSKTSEKESDLSEEQIEEIRMLTSRAYANTLLHDRD